jgi:glycosyltransferase involved in cell wall biosynthesis
MSDLDLNAGVVDGPSSPPPLTDSQIAGGHEPMSAPAISVLMPAHNAGRYVAKAVESILAQTYTDFEFLIVDDGSIDDTPKILRRYAECDRRIHIISRAKTGVVRALNELMALARGNLIARMDADDIALPTRFERQVAYLKDHPECVLVGSRVFIIDPEGDELTILGRALSHEEIVDDLLAHKGQMVYHPAVMFRRHVVVGIGGYDDRMVEAEDLDLFLRLAEVGRIINLPDPLLKYREHLKKSCRARAKQLEPYTWTIVNEARKRRGMEALPTSSDSNCSPRTPAQVHQTWGWWALTSGHVPTARKHAWASLARAPHSLSSWRLMYCALRGH